MTHTPYRIDGGIKNHVICDDRPICSIRYSTGHHETTLENEKIAEFIVKACNAHDELVAALELCVESIVEMGQSAAPFISGAISSRNPKVCAALAATSHTLTSARAALEKVQDNE